MNIIEEINVIKKTSSYFKTNAYFMANQLVEMQDAPGIKFYKHDKSIILLEDNKEFYRMYFYSGDLENIQELKATLFDRLEKQVICDVVLSRNDCDNVIKALRCAGFSIYSVYARMYINSVRNIEATPIEVIDTAGPDDTDDIVNMLENRFDMLDAHLPSTKEIVEAISMKEIKIIRINNNIAALSYLKQRGRKSLELRYIVVDEKFRGRGLGENLLINVLNHSSGKDSKCVLWVNKQNSKAISLYKKVGFVDDCVENYVMVYPDSSSPT